MAITIGGGLSLGTPSLPFINNPAPITIAPAQVFMVPPGKHIVYGGSGYASLEVYDSMTGFWDPAQYPPLQPVLIDSDGANYRIINRTGCPTGAIITNTGSSYTSVPTAAISTGGSKWVCVVGGSINTSVTVTTAGTYNYVPSIFFSAPPPGGVRAAGYVTLSAAAISTVTVTNAGAGYLTAPTVTIVPDPRETGSGGGVLTVNATLQNAQKVTAIYCTDPGTTAQTTTPTLSFSGGGGGGAAATVIMNYTVTGYTVTNKGSSLGTSGNFIVESGAYQSTATSAVTDPQLDVGVANSRMARLLGYTNSSGNAIASNTSLTTIDAGWGFQQAPSLYIIPDINSAVPSGFVATTLAATVGGSNDTWYIQNLGI